jgi:hypothetical protein
MLKGNKLKFQRGAVAKTEGEDRNNGGENRPHVVTVRPAREDLQPFLGLWKFEQGQPRKRRVELQQRAGAALSSTCSQHACAPGVDDATPRAGSHGIRHMLCSAGPSTTAARPAGSRAADEGIDIAK